MAMKLAAMRVLIADSNPHMRSLVATVLAAIGVVQFKECSNGEEAYEDLRKWGPDVAIIAYKMEPCDGLEFTKRVRTAADSPNPFLPIIMLTAYASRTLVTDARDAGVTEFMSKPMTAQAVLDRLNLVIFKPRAFVRSIDYSGPDRRRKTDAKYAGPWRREGDAAREDSAATTAQM